MQDFTPVNPEYKEMVRKQLAGNHFMNFIGFEIKDIKPGYVSGELELKEQHLQQMGYLHGGVTATVADIVCGFSIYTLLGKNQGVVTVDLNVAYLNPGIGDKLVANSTVLKAGNRIFFSEGEVWVESKNKRILVAKVSATMAVLNFTEESNPVK